MSARRRPLVLGVLAGLAVASGFAVGAIRLTAYMIDVRAAGRASSGLDFSFGYDAAPLFFEGDRLFRLSVLLVMLFGLVFVLASAVVALRELASTEQLTPLPGATLVVMGLTLVVAGALASHFSVLRADRAIEAVGLTPELATSQHALAVAESLSTLIFALFGAMAPAFIGSVLIGLAASRSP